MVDGERGLIVRITASRTGWKPFLMNGSGRPVMKNLTLGTSVANWPRMERIAEVGLTVFAFVQRVNHDHCQNGGFYEGLKWRMSFGKVLVMYV